MYGEYLVAATDICRDLQEVKVKSATKLYLFKYRYLKAVQYRSISTLLVPTFAYGGKNTAIKYMLA